MKNFNEWRQDVSQYEDPDTLMEKLQGLAHELEVQVDAFQGERFEGFLNILGSIKELKRTLAEITHGIH